MANFNIGEVIYRKEYEDKEAYLILGVKLTPYKKYMLYSLTVERIHQNDNIPWHCRVFLTDHNKLLITSKDKSLWGKLGDDPVAE
jgi:hypothetical protein